MSFWCCSSSPKAQKVNVAEKKNSPTRISHRGDLNMDADTFASIAATVPSTPATPATSPLQRTSLPPLPPLSLPPPSPIDPARDALLKFLIKKKNVSPDKAEEIVAQLEAKHERDKVRQELKLRYPCRLTFP